MATAATSRSAGVSWPLMTMKCTLWMPHASPASELLHAGTAYAGLQKKPQHCTTTHVLSHLNARKAKPLHWPERVQYRPRLRLPHREAIPAEFG